MDNLFGVEIAEKMRQRKLLDADLRRQEVREHPDLPGVEECLVLWSG